MKRVSIKDVAREAGVSTTTISYVLNNRLDQNISHETTARVLDVVKKLGYVPNLSARSLISRKSNLIGVIIPQTEPGKEFMFSNPFYGEFLSSVEYTARQNGYHLLISGTEKDQSYMAIARNRDVDGIIIVGTYPSEYLEELKQIGVPAILVDAYITDGSFPAIGIDDRLGGLMATRYLLQKGHRRIAFVSGVLMKDGVIEKRFLGYRDALAEADVPYESDYVYTGSVGYEYGMQAAKEMQCRGNRETAAFVTADIMAMGFVKGQRILGRTVPGDISVVGFDDLYLATICDPSLTTIHQDIQLKGEMAVRMVIEANRKKDGKKQDILLPVSLVERDSVRSLAN
jgi:LacI family transcriptional regulator